MFVAGVIHFMSIPITGVKETLVFNLEIRVQDRGDDYIAKGQALVLGEMAGSEIPYDHVCCFYDEATAEYESPIVERK